MAKVTLREAAPQVTVPAWLIASDQAVISFPYETMIAEKMVKVGDRVTRDDPLLQLYTVELNLQRNQIKASQRETQAELKKAKFRHEHRDELLDEGKMDESQYANTVNEITYYEAAMAKLTADLALVEHRLERSSVGSPIDGLVVSAPYSTGVNVPAGETLLKIVNTRPIMAEFRLPADVAGGIKVGDTVAVRIDELPGITKNGVVQFISPSLQLPEQNFTVWITIPNGDDELKIGMRGFAQFRTSKKQKLYIIPAAAVVMRRHRPHVFVIMNGIAKLRQIKVAAINRDEAELTGGVNEGEWVAIKGQEGLQNGSIVDIR